VISLDRQYAKEMLNSIGAAQSVTDKVRANIALSFHCLSLSDVFWVKKVGEDISFFELDLYDRVLNSATVDLSLNGNPAAFTLLELAPDLSTKGCFPKAWIRTEHGFKLLKDGGNDAVRRELLASEICQCFDVPQVVYRPYDYHGQIVTESEIVSSKEYSMVSKLSYEVYAINHDLDVIDVAIKLDPITYYGMNILDYLTGNTDRHPENWGFLVDNATNQPVSLYPIMDFNQCFLSYDSLDGANCQTVLPRKLTQKEAAIEAVKAIGLRQIRDINVNMFGNLTDEAEMFHRRLEELKSQC
jgi:hypothetical protein